MEPRKDKPQKVNEPRKEERKSRFQIVKLEERIAPGGSHHGKSQNHSNCFLCFP
jgi:hypothetical protein